MPFPILMLEITLVALGIVFLILEFKLPGHFISAGAAIVCFAAFFCLHFALGGELVFVAVVLFVLGLVLLGIEIFLMPGHGVPGVCGVLLILAGLVAASVSELPKNTSDWAGLLQIAFRHVLTMAMAGIVALQLAKHLPEIPYVNRLVRSPPEDNPEPEPEEALLGQIGTATSTLRPAGIAQFGERRVDVSTEWEFIDPGTRVQVVEVEGPRIVVRKV